MVWASGRFLDLLVDIVYQGGPSSRCVFQVSSLNNRLNNRKTNLGLISICQACFHISYLLSRDSILTLCEPKSSLCSTGVSRVLWAVHACVLSPAEQIQVISKSWPCYFSADDLERGMYISFLMAIFSWGGWY